MNEYEAWLLIGRLLLGLIAALAVCLWTLAALLERGWWPF